MAVFVEYESDVKEEQERVKKLLENLRIQAEVLVMWLSRGDLHSYEVIVNGLAPEGDDDVEEILGKEEWWRELQKRRGQASSQDSPNHLADLAQLVSGAQWPSSSFQQANRLGSHTAFGGLHKLIKKPRRRHSMFGLTRLGMSVSLNMRTHRLNPDALDHGSASELSSDEESSDALLSDEESAVSAASENDADEYDEQLVSVPKARRASVGDPLGLGMLSRRQTLRQTALKSSALKSSPGDVPRAPPPHNSPPASSSGGDSSRSASASLPVRPEPPHRSSTPTFSCRAIPDTQVAAEEGAGPSIMFADSKPRRTTSPPAQPHPLSFNDLPSRAQHLILNELIRKYSQDTAVVFTTLPSPQSGTFKSEKDSLEYLTGLEVIKNRAKKDHPSPPLLRPPPWSTLFTHTDIT